MFAHDHLELRLLRLKPSEEWRNPGHGFSFLFPTGGAGTLVASPVQHPLAPGDVLVLSEAQGGMVCAAEAGELAFWHFSLYFEHLYPLFGNNELCLLQSVTEFFRSPRLYPAAMPLAQECHQLLAAAPPLHHLDHRGQLLRVATAILTAEFKDARRRRGGFVSAEDHLSQVFEQLLVADIMGLRVQELAEKFQCSQRHLNRLFHRYFGFSVAALRMEMRLIKAVSLLRDRDAKVIRVAEQCGFNHLGLFNSCFKRRFGASPGRWRNADRPPRPQPAPLIQGDPVCQMRANGLCPWAGQTRRPAAQPRTPQPKTRPPEPRPLPEGSPCLRPAAAQWRERTSRGRLRLEAPGRGARLGGGPVRARAGERHRLMNRARTLPTQERPVLRGSYAGGRTIRRAMELLCERRAKVIGIVFDRANSPFRSYEHYKYAD